MVFHTPFKRLIELWKDVVDKHRDNKVVIYDSTSYKNLLSRPIAATVSEDDLQEAYKLLIDDGDHQWHLNSAYIKSRDEALKLIIEDRLWEKDFYHQHSMTYSST